MARWWSRQQATRHIISKQANKEVRSRRKSLRELSNAADKLGRTTRHKFAASHRCPKHSLRAGSRTEVESEVERRKRDGENCRKVFPKISHCIQRTRLSGGLSSASVFSFMIRRGKALSSANRTVSRFITRERSTIFVRLIDFPMRTFPFLAAPRAPRWSS